MSIPVIILLIAHFLGLALIIGGFAMQLGRRSGYRFGLMLAGAITQFVSGIAMVGIIEMTSDWDLNMVKISIKLTITMIALIAAIVGLVRQRKVDSGALTNPKAAVPYLHITGAAALINVIIAVAWR